MHLTTKTLCLSLLIATTGVFAQQEVPTPTERFNARVDARQDRQQERIGNGVENGSLNAKEAARMQRQQVGVARHEQLVEADGRVTRKEARGLERHQDKTSRHIYRQKHDRQVQRGSRS